MFLWAQEGKRPFQPSVAYDVARTHEIKPHRRTVPLAGVREGFNQLRLSLKVSSTGDVVDVTANGDPEALKFWPQVEGEVRQWKFTPFEEHGKTVTAEVEEYVDLVPPERLPKIHVPAPPLRQNSSISIGLTRTGCFGTCPSYTVTIGTDGIVFDGHAFIVASEKHRDAIDQDKVRDLARKFVAADFYSMDASYRAGVTDNPTYVLSLDIDGYTKQVEDYVGSWVGMPQIINELEDDVDSVGRTGRWIAGDEGLVEELQMEGFNFQSSEAQLMLKEAATRGKTETVRDFLAAGVPLEPVHTPKPTGPSFEAPLDSVGWLTAASAQPETLHALIDAKASENDQGDKDLALAGAARSGEVEAARALIGYGANPNADLSQRPVPNFRGPIPAPPTGAGPVLIAAAISGNPDMVHLILGYHPDLEKRDGEGKTAVFAAAEYGNETDESGRVECLRLLAEAGADVNARDKDGNTPLHETFLTGIEEELLKLGADVNARNHDGETPIFTTLDRDAIPLFIEHGADLAIRNNRGETVIEATKNKGAEWQEALRSAIQNSKQSPE